MTIFLFRPVSPVDGTPPFFTKIYNLLLNLQFMYSIIRYTKIKSFLTGCMTVQDFMHTRILYKSSKNKT